MYTIFAFVIILLAVIAVILILSNGDATKSTAKENPQAIKSGIPNDKTDISKLPRDIPMLVVTTENIKGYDYEVIGECFGLTTQSKDIMSNIGAGFKNVVGGEIKAYTQMLQTSRMEAIRRMKQDAKSKGADAIVMMRFDTDSMVEGVQTVVAYGTAVKLKEITTESRSPKE